MRASDFISETKISKGKLNKSASESIRGLHLFTDNIFDRFYILNRIAMAAGSSDGTTNFNMETESWAGKSNTAHPYSKIEADKLKSAYKKVGVNFNDLNNSDLESRELEDVNNKSPITPFKGYKK